MSRHTAAADDPPSPPDAAAASRHAVSGGDDVTSQRRHGPRDVADHVAGLLVRQCRSWTTRLSAADDVDTPSTPSTSPATVSRPPPSPRPSLTGPAPRPGDTRPFPAKSDGAVETPPPLSSSACLFASNSTEDEVVVVDAVAAVATTAGSDTSSGRGSASPDTRSTSSRGKSRFKKMLRPLRRTWSAGCSDEFRAFHHESAAHKPTTGVQQVARPFYTSLYTAGGGVTVSEVK